MNETCHIKYWKIWYGLAGRLAFFPCKAESLRGYCLNIVYDYIAEKYSTDGRERYISTLAFCHAWRKNILCLFLSRVHTHSHPLNKKCAGYSHRCMNRIDSEAIFLE